MDDLSLILQLENAVCTSPAESMPTSCLMHTFTMGNMGLCIFKKKDLGLERDFGAFFVCLGFFCCGFFVLFCFLLMYIKDGMLT